MSQFKKMANVYFLIISFMQTIKSISISDGKSVMAIPLVVVIGVSMIKDAYEDYKRHQSDAQENEKKIACLENGKFVEKQWQQLHVGNILKIKCDQFVPADLLILHSSDKKGCCYVETKNLDGETNLKIKNTQKDLNYYFKNEGDLTGINGEIICEKPNNAIHKFEGQISIANHQDKIPLGPENIILRGCSLRNTDYVYGVCVFTGHDTKLMKNSANAKYKFSTLEVMTNNAILLILGTQIIMSCIGSLVGSTWTYKNSQSAMDLAEC